MTIGQIAVTHRCRWPHLLADDVRPVPIARLRYTKTSKTWSLLWRDRNLRFHEYDRVAPSARVDDLLSEIEWDPTAIFWG